jgi:xanthine dehydrogenase accessory factor
MNFSLLDSILASRHGVLATVIAAHGHTYKGVGHQALYEPDEIEAVHGNLGALCADQAIIARSAEARKLQKPIVMTIDASAPTDGLTGTGSGCGGAIEVLLEPVDGTHKAVYARLIPHLEDGPPVWLVHELESGELRIEQNPKERANAQYVEKIDALTPLVLFGATPLARRMIAVAADMSFAMHLVDGRPAFLERFRHVPRLSCHDTSFTPPPTAYVVIMSHSYERDLAALRSALVAGCRYIGLLSSRGRRDRIFEALAGEGFTAAQRARVCSPVGLEIGAKTDPEIAISILGEIITRLRT